MKPPPTQKATRPLATVNEDIKGGERSASKGFGGGVWPARAPDSSTCCGKIAGGDGAQRRAERREVRWQSAAALTLSPHVSHAAGDRGPVSLVSHEGHKRPSAPPTPTTSGDTQTCSMR